MSEENNKNLKSLPKHVQENLSKQIDSAFLHEKIKEEIMNDPKYDSFFENYNKNSKESFADTYKWKKANWIEYGEMYLRHEQDKIFKYQNIAEECLWQIQQKKLFNLQCEWRAEKIQIPEIEISWDFKVWENEIKNCNFIEPIKEDEVELYKQYILCDDFQTGLLDIMSNWQDYEEYKENYENEEDENIIPEWYQFYDSRLGTGVLLSLPDLRGEKEEFYRDINFKEERKKKAEEIERQKREGTYKEITYDKRPFMSAYGEYLEEFVNTFEDEKIKRLYRAYESMNYDDLEDDEDLSEAIQTLLEANERIEIDGWYDWREAVIKTAKKYERKKIYDYMDAVYKDYLNRRAMGISYEKSKEQHDASLKEMLKEQIIKGRKLNGEPEDLNF